MTTTEETVMTTQPTPPPAPPRRLRRRATGRVLGGVCGGVADYAGLDVALVRLIAVLLALVSGVGVVAYVAAWALLPVAGDERSPVEQRFER
jgi:phage shock protein C